MNPRLQKLYTAQNGRCHWCDCPMIPGGEQNLSATIDHLAPRTLPGTQRPVVAAHRGCNNKRHHDPNPPADYVKKVQLSYARGAFPFGASWEIVCRTSIDEQEIRRMTGKPNKKLQALLEALHKETPSLLTTSTKRDRRDAKRERRQAARPSMVARSIGMTFSQMGNMVAHK